ncbi:hypothetical protein ONS95_005482 [Cadophora gregata]|uniref:uncharacterized protein n=1 Tax=Cadophora gregata TaxID=51156 RepID=UPI0026DCE4D0|nr:uncharacterized protein ONS95_005482 [Cadophora gregata]KAK0103459.1 hypothetical protein ONS95_005482 [Cadophora gregata]KAK0107649.1 hypothetical protein ONS96_003452 [Cadophora gregata f. sp. sojae]
MLCKLSLVSSNRMLAILMSILTVGGLFQVQRCPAESLSRFSPYPIPYIPSHPVLFLSRCFYCASSRSQVRNGREKWPLTGASQPGRPSPRPTSVTIKLIEAPPQHLTTVSIVQLWIDGV